MAMRIVVDRQRCMGSGSCAFHAPGTFDLDDDLRVVVLGGSVDEFDAVRRAVAGCPTRAIELRDEE